MTDKQLATILVALADKHDSITDVVESFLSYLREQQLLHRAKGVMRALEIVWKETYGAATITIDTAHALTEEMRTQLNTVARGADIRERVQPELIGGARIRIDDRILDGSIAGKLNSLKTTLS